MLSSVHVHSSVSGVPPQLLSCLGPRHTESYTRQHFQLGFTLIWKDGKGKNEDVVKVVLFWECKSHLAAAQFLMELIWFPLSLKTLINAGKSGF